MQWLWLAILVSIAVIVVAAVFTKKEHLTMLSENKVTDGWGNVTITP